MKLKGKMQENACLTLVLQLRSKNSVFTGGWVCTPDAKMTMLSEIQGVHRLLFQCCYNNKVLYSLLT